MFWTVIGYISFGVCAVVSLSLLLVVLIDWCTSTPDEWKRNWKEAKDKVEEKTKHLPPMGPVKGSLWSTE
jgi:hypothetical protein